MAVVKQVVRIVLFLHGVFNILQGAYSVLRPLEFAKAAGVGYEGAPDKAIQSIGTSHYSVIVLEASLTIIRPRIDRRWHVWRTGSCPEHSKILLHYGSLKIAFRSYHA